MADSDSPERKQINFTIVPDDQPGDARTDVYSSGITLYEMLTGCAAFEGEDIPEILSRVLQRDPDWTLLPANVPLRIRELIRLD